MNVHTGRQTHHPPDTPYPVPLKFLRVNGYTFSTKPPCRTSRVVHGQEDGSLGRQTVVTDLSVVRRDVTRCRRLPFDHPLHGRHYLRRRTVVGRGKSCSIVTYYGVFSFGQNGSEKLIPLSITYERYLTFSTQDTKPYYIYLNCTWDRNSPNTFIVFIRVCISQTSVRYSIRISVSVVSVSLHDNFGSPPFSYKSTPRVPYPQTRRETPTLSKRGHQSHLIWYVSTP